MGINFTILQLLVLLSQILVPSCYIEAYQLLTLNDHPNTWCRKIQRILNEAGFSYVWSNPCEVDPTQFIKAIRQTLHIQYIQEWNGLLTASSKLRTYRLFKNTLKYEPYLNLPPYLRVPLARLRTSAHGLKIETGRYTIPNPTPVEERLCDLCGVTEDEVHFLINCPMTDNKERSNLFGHCTSLLPSLILDTSPQETSSYLLCPAKTQQLYHIWPCQLVVHSSPEPLDFIIDYNYYYYFYFLFLYLTIGPSWPLHVIKIIN